MPPMVHKVPEGAKSVKVLPCKRAVACQAQQSNNQEPTRRKFSQLGFVRVRLERVTTTKQGHYGYLVFVRHESRRPWLGGGSERGLVVHITGDTLYCLCKLLRNEPTARPMPLDILSGIISQASDQSPDEWGIVRVAITSLQHDTYIARAYFGVLLLVFSRFRLTDSMTVSHWWVPVAHTDTRGVQVTKGLGRLHGSKTFDPLMPHTWLNSGKSHFILTLVFGTRQPSHTVSCKSQSVTMKCHMTILETRMEPRTTHCKLVARTVANLLSSPRLQMTQQILLGYCVLPPSHLPSIRMFLCSAPRN